MTLRVIPKGEPLDGHDLLENICFEGRLVEGLDGPPVHTHDLCKVRVRARARARARAGQ